MYSLRNYELHFAMRQILLYIFNKIDFVEKKPTTFNKHWINFDKNHISEVWPTKQKRIIEKKT